MIFGRVWEKHLQFVYIWKTKPTAFDGGLDVAICWFCPEQVEEWSGHLPSWGRLQEKQEGNNGLNLDVLS